MKKHYKHIVFDIDGTMTDTKYAVLHAFQLTLKERHQIEKEMEELYFAFGIPGMNAVKELGIEDVEGTMKEWNTRIKSLHHTITIFDGIATLLETLKKNGYKLGIVTSKTKAECESEFTPYGLAHHFDTIVCVDDTDKHKPDPEPLFKYMEITGAKQEEMLYLGDTKYDLACAHDAGIDFALALWGCLAPEPLLPQSEYALTTPMDMLTILEK